MLNKLFDLEHDQRGFKTIFHALMGVVLLLAGNILSSLPIDLFYSLTNAESSPFTVVVRTVLNILVLLLLVYLYVVKGFKMKWSDFRIGKPRNLAIWMTVAIILPLAVSAFFVLLVPGTFASSGFERQKIIQYIIRAFFSSCLVAGITEELVFRGFIMRLLEIRWNKNIAIVLPSVLFGLIHILNMEQFNIIDVLQLLCAGTAVGIMFSMIAYQSGSIWASAAVHGVWNFVIVGGILGIDAEPWPSIYTYTLDANSTLLTGGAFGIESSLPAVIGYGIIILLAVFLLRRNVAKASAGS
ncbi:CPBP family intramembrane metalloprotease [Lachnospiraceae bacterium OttesenSCG-928-D06]|nr:CPBP family intramembrane metalloprotease [Lachnospiraceae bacterium OttesenSCG-928-D06]